MRERPLTIGLGWRRRVGAQQAVGLQVGPQVSRDRRVEPGEVPIQLVDRAESRADSSAAA